MTPVEIGGGSIVALLTAALVLINKVWQPKSLEEIARARISEQRRQEAKFEETGNNTDIGKLP